MLAQAPDDPQSVLDAAVARGDLPFAVGFVGGPEGTLWQGAAGEAAPGRPAGLNTVFQLFSMTKAVGAVAAAILVERGRLALDAPVGEALPAFDALPVLDGWDGGTPRLRPQRARATLRQLLSHRSGAAYDTWNQGMRRYRRLTGLPSPRSGRLAALSLPLAFDPGAGWAYGMGLDWTGLLIQAVDGRRIDVFCREEIFAPLGMTETGFALEPALAPRLAALRVREGGDFAVVDALTLVAPEFHGLGHGLIGTAPDYLRLLRMLLRGGELDGRRLMSEATVRELFANQIGGRRLGVIPSFQPEASADVDFGLGGELTWSLLGLRAEAAVPGRRAAGSQGWGGILNTLYWLDPARGRAGILMTQLRPYADPRVVAVLDALERAVYAR
jgi:CubicO group peptidase (beta-lactamase class C family)